MQSLVTVCGFLFLSFSVHTHVVKDFKECEEYFYNNFVPQGLNSSNDVHICQTYKDKYYFATLYDTSHRIPVYSAYILESSVKHKDPRWCVEPQLVDNSCDKNMMTTKALRKSECGAEIDGKKIGERQAVDKDYTGLLKQGYNRGHLNPKGHHKSLSRRATFTLTNVVPQNSKLNQGAWADYENNVKNILKGCKKVYVLVGAIPSADNWTKRENDDNGVNIPSHLWHAYCCIKKNKLKSGAATAENKDTTVWKLSLNKLKGFLKTKLQKEKAPELFDNNCKPV